LIARHGFAVPPTIVTNSPPAIEEFQRRHGQVIFKSSSGVRSIVRKLDSSSRERLELIKNCPVQFQRYIDGTNIRVHVIGKEVLAGSVESTEVDYRYSENGTIAEPFVNPLRLPAQIEERCVSLSHALGLEFAGIDLKLGTDGIFYCFEVNPMPDYSFFQRQSGADIADHLVRLLSSG
jgi:glutathione synthase/RimK-type ligase-like ATP-grasp enzyme